MLQCSEPQQPMCVRFRPVDHTPACRAVGPDLLIRVIADWEKRQRAVTDVAVAPKQSEISEELTTL